MKKQILGSFSDFCKMFSKIAMTVFAFILTILLLIIKPVVLYAEFLSVYQNCTFGFPEWKFDNTYSEHANNSKRQFIVGPVTSECREHCQKNCAEAFGLYQYINKDQSTKGSPILDLGKAELNKGAIFACIKACYNGSDYTVKSLFVPLGESEGPTADKPLTFDKKEISCNVKSGGGCAVGPSIGSAKAPNFPQFAHSATPNTQFIISIESPQQSNDNIAHLDIIDGRRQNAIYLDGIEVVELYPAQHPTTLQQIIPSGLGNKAPIWAANVEGYTTVLKNATNRSVITIEYAGIHISFVLIYDFMNRSQTLKRSVSNNLLISMDRANRMPVQTILEPPALFKQFYNPKYFASGDQSALSMLESDRNAEVLARQKTNQASGGFLQSRWISASFLSAPKALIDQNYYNCYVDKNDSSLCSQTFTVKVNDDFETISACNQDQYRADKFVIDNYGLFAETYDLSIGYPIPSSKSALDGMFNSRYAFGGYNVRITHAKNVATNGEFLAYIFVDTDLEDDDRINFLKDNRNWKQVNLNTNTKQQTIYAPTEQKGKRYDGYFKILPPDGNKFEQNITAYGNYTVGVITKQSFSDSSFICDWVSRIHGALFGKDDQGGIAGDMYRAIANAKTFHSAVMAAIALYFTYMGVNFLLGISRTPQADFFGMALKLALIGALLSPTSWNFFYQNFFSFVINGLDETINKFTINVDLFNGQQCKIGGRIMPAMILLFDYFWQFDGIWTRIIGLGLKITTLVTFILMVISILMYAYGVIFIILSYISSLFVLTIVIILSPVFLCCTLFKVTQQIFTEFLKQIIASFLIPVAMFSMFSILQIVFIALIYNTFNFSLCRSCIPVLKWFSDIFCQVPQALDVMHDTSFLGGLSARTTFGSIAIFITAQMIASIPSFLEAVIKAIVSTSRSAVGNMLNQGTLVQGLRSTLNAVPLHSPSQSSGGGDKAQRQRR